MPLALPILALMLLANLPPGHPPLTPSADAGVGAAPSAEELLQKLQAQPDLKNRIKSFDVAASMGKLFYASGKFADARGFLAEASAKTAAAQKVVVTARKSGGQPAASCPVEGGRTVESLIAAAASAAKPVALACATEALGPAWQDVQRLLAQSQFLTADMKGALASYDALLAVVDDPAGRYGRAAVLLEAKGDDKAALQEARNELRKVIANPHALRSVDAQKLLTRVDAVVAAGGVTAYGKAQAAKAKGSGGGPMAQGSGPPQLTQEMVDAVENTERTPELEQGLAKLVEEAEEKLAKEQFQEALDAYKRVVPFQPKNGRAQAGMAWSLVGLNKQPMADRVWSVAVQSDASAVDKLGDTLKAKGNEKSAKAVWTRLQASAPDYAQRANLGAKLK